MDRPEQQKIAQEAAVQVIRQHPWASLLVWFLVQFAIYTVIEAFWHNQSPDPLSFRAHVSYLLLKTVLVVGFTWLALRWHFKRRARQARVSSSA